MKSFRNGSHWMDHSDYLFSASELSLGVGNVITAFRFTDKT